MSNVEINNQKSCCEQKVLTADMPPSKKFGLNSGWLDTAAITMSMLCAIHCLITPVLLIALPIISSTFFASSDFHLWMLAFVIPTTTLAMFLGCKKHRNFYVIALSALGLITLSGVAIYEWQAYNAAVAAAHCELCVAPIEKKLMSPVVLTNLAGGLPLISAHACNFYLCRTKRCTH